jgi:hypothetical protein
MFSLGFPCNGLDVGFVDNFTFFISVGCSLEVLCSSDYNFLFFSKMGEWRDFDYSVDG